VTIERALRSLSELIVRCCDPDRVLLFGSYAKGQENATSDLDVLVIGDFRESPYLRGDQVRQIVRRRYPIRVDLHFVTRAEVAAAADTPHSFLGSVLRTSVCLYRRDEDIDIVSPSW
jgi:predicted nucleotidyltransferase